MARLIVCIMGQDCEKFIRMCLESVKEADNIVYCDGGSVDNTINLVESMIVKGQGDEVIYNRYDQEDKKMNGKQRNFYLKYLKENYPNDWALCLDADEVVENLDKIKEFIQTAEPGVYSPKMRHLIGDLGNEDATKPVHHVLNRLFKINQVDSYPEVEHPVLRPLNKSSCGVLNDVTIWHLAYCPNMWEIKKRYENHLKKSNMHTPEYLKEWYKAHLFGRYPKRQFNPIELPNEILTEFGIDKEELYFEGRNIQMNHPLMVKQWNDFFKPESVLCLGCGKGPYVFFWEWLTDVRGIEKSEYAVNNAFSKKVEQGDCTKEEAYCGKKGAIHEYSLITAIDLLEHLTKEQLSKTIKLIKEYSKNVLISIPFKGTPNCENDPTHLIKESKGWWVEQFTKEGWKLIQTPNDFLFKDQLKIFKTK